ncbi:hypothetical protein XFF6992_250002 [Xanthomonas citri pv. fuscans]|nr:hypothetical protein XFF6992_250002 [Xanthomonas citri pv. fuscans]
MRQLGWWEFSERLITSVPEV